MSLTVAVTPSHTRQAPIHPLDEMVHTSLPGVKFLANRLASRLPANVDVEDLVQVGVVGLLQSADRFDPRRGVKFQTYANRRVEGAMLDYLRSLDWRPRSVRQRNRNLKEAVAAVEQRLGDSATSDALAVEVGISAPELGQWMQALLSSDPWTSSSFSEGSPEDGPRDVLADLPDPADSPEAVVEREQMRKVMAEAVDRLPRKERVVLSLYYYEQLTMREIGEVMGVKQGRISQLHSQAIQRLRNRMRRTPGKQMLPNTAPAQAAERAAA